MLRSLTTRDVFGLMHVTLVAFEIRCAHDASPPDDAAASEQNTAHTEMQSLYHCGLAALRDLNREAFVNNFDENAGVLWVQRTGCNWVHVAPRQGL